MLEKLLPLLFLPLMASAVFAQSGATQFADIPLPLGVSVKVPKNWWIIDGDLNAAIETSAEAIARLSGMEMPDGKKTNLFRANSMPRSTFAGIEVNASDASVSADDIRGLTDSDLVEFTQMTREVMDQVSAKTDTSVIEVYPAEKREVDGHPALFIGYKRTGNHGPVIVRTMTVPIGSKEISLNLSYRESEAVLWKAVIEYMEKSIRISDH